jgi:acyl transferase domain-containing protein/NADP-dependent 3-hydroxy acid dehydrogenase YdfG/acyl carrier protein
MGCRFPGGADSPKAFWDLLARGIDAIREVPDDRWSARAYYAPAPPKPGRTYSKWGGYLDRVDQFDSAFFGISPREAASMDPQQRMFLEVAWEALECAGLPREALAGWPVGVFVGASSNDYTHLQKSTDRSQSLVTPYSNSGGALSIIGNRLSYLLDLRGPSFTVDTACSSSLVALHCACESLRSGEIEAAIVGGTNALLSPGPFIGFSAAHMLSPDGRCRSFGAAANGYARAEGAGAIVLKLLSRARADGDPVLALILATGVNQDGRTAGLSLPNEEAQAALLEAVYRRAGVRADEVGYVEAHGTGTLVGDPIEARALGRVLGQPRTDGSVLQIGSVKSNFGHLEPASGVAGVIKAVLALQRRALPPSLHAETLNPTIDFDALRLDVVREPRPWTERLVCGVNSFGFGGTNAHAVLAAAPVELPRVEQKKSPAPVRIPAPSASSAWSTLGEVEEPVADERPASLVVLSAASAPALEDAVASWSGWLGASDAARPSFEEIAWTAARRRSHLTHRLAAVARDGAELGTLLAAWRAGEKRREVASGRVSPGRRLRVAFVYNGMGSQWPGMGGELLESEPAFRRAVEEVDVLFRARSGWSIVEHLRHSEFGSRVDEAEVAQPAIFAVQVGLTALWKSWGVEPDCVMGHSVGEAASAWASGALSLEEAVDVIWHRSRLQQTLRGRGRMLAVGLSAELVSPWVESCAGRVEIAAINSPSSVTLAGGADDLDELHHAMQAGQTFCRFLNVDVPYHSAVMDEIGETLQAALNGISSRATQAEFYSTVDGGSVREPRLDGGYWRRNARQTVLFESAMKAALESGVDVVVEIGAHPVLSSAIRECQGNGESAAPIVSTMRRHEPQRAALLAALGRLHVLGVPICWDRVFPENRPVAALPAMPWRRETFWSESNDNRIERLGLTMSGPGDIMGPLAYPLLGHPIRTSQQEKLWVIRLDLTAEHAWLADHQVQGTPVFPGAGFVELALAAGRTLHPGRALSLENTEIQRPLVLSMTRSNVVETLMDPYSGDTTLRSRTSDGGATLHAAGRVLPDFQPWDDGPDRLAAIRALCPTSHPIDGAYEWFAALGLQYGPAFRGIEELATGDGVAWGRVRMPAELTADAPHFALCPAVLDACLQTMLLAMRQADSETAIAYLPVRLRRLRLRDAASAAIVGGVQVTARIVAQDETRLVGEASLYDQSGQLIAEVEGIEAVALPTARRAVRSEECLWEQRIEQHPLAGDPFQGELPTPNSLVDSMRGRVPALRDETDRARYYAELAPAATRLCTAYFVSALRALGVSLEPGRVFTAREVATTCGVVEPYERLVHAMLAALVRAGDAERVGDAFRILREPEASDPEVLWREIGTRFPESGNALLLPQRAGAGLSRILRGELNPLEVLFPEGSTALAESLYEDSPQFRIYNRMLQGVFAALAERIAPERPLRVLEIGGGTGSATAFLLPMLPAERTHYVFTDVSAQFLGAAGQRFRDYPFVRCETLDLERDPFEQGFEPRSFDVVLAGDVLHALPDVRGALQRVRSLLADGGLLIMLEPILQDSLLDLCLGILRGWWQFADAPLRTESPLLPTEAWRALLETGGFDDIQDLSDADPGEAAVHAILVARAAPRSEGWLAPAQPNAASSAATPPIPETTTQPSAGPCWIVADRGPVAAALQRRLDAAGVTTVLIRDGAEFSERGFGEFDIRFQEAEDFRRLCETAAARGLRPTRIVHALDADCRDDLTSADIRRSLDEGVLPALWLMQNLARANWNPPPRVWLVTRGADAAGITTGEPLGVRSAPLVGLARVAFNECVPLRPSLVDLGPRCTSAQIDALCRELLADSDETEVIVRDAARFVPRLTNAAARFQSPFQPGDDFRLEVAAPGILESAVLVPSDPPATPGPDEVTLEIEAAAVNFKDVAKALRLLSDATLDGTWSGRSLGLECAGRVTAVGADVAHLKLGDRVVAIARDCFRPRITIPAAFVCRIPDRLSTTSATGLPIVFLTAHLALNRMARIGAGERVLVHAAAGGVGLAAVQIARNAGAEVIATAGSTMKRDYLRALGVEHVFDSRTLSFVEDVRRCTGGRGVDAVLNSLAGAMIPASLSLLAPGGRFLEIGKRDIQENVSLGLRPFDNNLAFLALDLDRLLARDSAAVAPMLSELMASFDRGTLTPIPARTFPISRAGEAFRHVAKARQVGKVVLSMRDAAIPARVRRPVARRTPRFDPDATYLVTGGLSGFGLETAKWLARRGARHLVLLSRRGATSLDAQQEVLELELTGVRVAALPCDVSNAEALAATLDTVRRTMPPLRGVYHAAMVLDDALMVQLDAERVRAVFAPKIDGAWNLHHLTRNDRLDEFVLFSSATTDVGNPGQANYVAACAFLDQLAAHRRNLGLPAVSVAWGPVDDVGYLARNADLHRHITERMGLPAISAAKLLEILESILSRPTARVSVARFDFSRIPTSALPVLKTPRLAALGGGAAGAAVESSESTGRIRELLLACSPEERRGLLKKHLVEILAGILGTSPSRIETDRSVLLMGLDSLMAVELQTRVAREIGREIPSMRLMSGPTLDELVDEMVEEMNAGAT